MNQKFVWTKDDLKIPRKKWGVSDPWCKQLWSLFSGNYIKTNGPHNTLSFAYKTKTLKNQIQFDSKGTHLGDENTKYNIADEIFEILTTKLYYIQNFSKI